MLSLSISRNSGEPLADQIVAGVRREIDDRRLRPGVKLPSIRKFAESHQISRSTVVESYDRLVAMGYLRSRPGAGFYAEGGPAPAAHPEAAESHKHNEPLVWLIRRLLEADERSDARRRPVAAEFVAGRSGHPPEPQCPLAQERRLCCSNTGSRLAISRYASISRRCWAASGSLRIRARFS